MDKPICILCKGIGTFITLPTPRICPMCQGSGYWKGDWEINNKKKEKSS